MRAIHVTPRLFGGPLRAGDIIASANFLEYLNKYENGPNWQDMKLYIPHELIYPQDHCMDMYLTLLETTNYITQFPDELLELHVIPGTDPTYSDMYNIWNIREDVLIPRQNLFTIPDAVVIPNHEPSIDNKVVIAPLLDAAYNHERNWPFEETQKILNWYCHCIDLEVIIACKKPIDFDIGHASYSHNYLDTLQHIRTCGIFVGGDSGLSHYASALQHGPECEFHYSKNTYGTTCPFYWKTKHKMVWY